MGPATKTKNSTLDLETAPLKAVKPRVNKIAVTLAAISTLGAVSCTPNYVGGGINYGYGSAYGNTNGCANRGVPVVGRYRDMGTGRTHTDYANGVTVYNRPSYNAAPIGRYRDMGTGRRYTTYGRATIYNRPSYNAAPVGRYRDMGTGRRYTTYGRVAIPSF